MARRRPGRLAFQVEQRPAGSTTNPNLVFGDPIGKGPALTALQRRSRQRPSDPVNIHPLGDGIDRD